MASASGSIIHLPNVVAKGVAGTAVQLAVVPASWIPWPVGWPDPTMPLNNNGQQAEWEGRYRARETGWDRGAASDGLLAWLRSGALVPCRILIPGCGRGYEAALLAERGFQVTALDIAPTAIKAVRGLLAQHGLTATVVQADLWQWETGKTFDAIYEQTSLCAQRPTTWGDYAGRLRQWLKPGGRLYALFMQTNKPEGPPFHCAEATMKQRFSPPHWQWPSDPPIRVDHPTGIHELGHVLVRT